MNCSYPNCRQLGTHIPIVEIPTIRSVGLIPPILSPLVQSHGHMRNMELDMAITIRMYEEQVAQYKAMVNNMVECDEPTILVGAVICREHAKVYRFLDWFGIEQWGHLQEGAREHGVLLDIKDVKVRWRPYGWEPGGNYMEIVR